MNFLRKRFGRCFECGRLMPMEYLVQIEYYDNHGIESGDFHHKLLCIGCIKKAEEIYEERCSDKLLS